MTTRYGYFLPVNTAFCSVNYIQCVLDKIYYCPLYSELTLRPCPRPPTKQKLIEKIEFILKKKGKTIGNCSKTAPDIKWLLAVLSTLDPKDPIFERNYVPPPLKRKRKDVDEFRFPVDFFKGQAPPTSKMVKRANSKTMNMMMRY